MVKKQTGQTLPQLGGAEASQRIYALACAEEPAEGLHLTGADLTGETLEKMSFARCVLENCRFTGAALGGASFTDCTLRGCDFSGAALLDAYFARCRVTGCKMTGANLGGSRLRSVAFADSLLALTAWEQAHWDTVDLSGCDLSEALLTGIAHKRLTLREVNLTGASVAGTSLRGLDLRSCTLTNLTAGEALREFRGAIVDAVGAAELAQALGVIIE